jgi:hypothetical protein
MSRARRLIWQLADASILSVHKTIAGPDRDAVRAFTKSLLNRYQTIMIAGPMPLECSPSLEAGASADPQGAGQTSCFAARASLYFAVDFANSKRPRGIKAPAQVMI